MKQQSHFYWITSCVLLVYLGASGITQAQIIPDKTLPTNSVAKSERNIINITGGTVSGRNLFHSFEKFSLRSGNVAYFDNSLKIQNIISRVTRSPSEIDGLIQANGIANLFLLSPKGIIFGPNASLKIGGSFLASTASSLSFDDAALSSAITPQAVPLLTVNVPTGLQFGSNPGAISVRKSSLEVQQNKTLALVGGDVRLEGGSLKAEGGRVELRGVAGPRKVRLYATDNSLRLIFPNNILREDVSLTNNAVVDVSAESGGSAVITGQNVSFTDGSSVMSDTFGLGKGRGLLVQGKSISIADDTQLLSRSGEGLAGDIVLSAQDKISLVNRTAIDSSTFGSGKSGRILMRANNSVSIKDFSSIRSDTFGQGEGNDIQIKTGSLFVTDADAAISSSTFVEGAAGGIVINAQDQVSLANSSIFSTTNGPGEGSGIKIKAKSLSLSNGARLSTVTSGAGNAGNVLVNAFDSINISGIDPSTGLASGLLTSTTADGKGGNIKVATNTFRLQDGAVLDARTAANQNNAGDAGNMTIEAGQVTVENGSEVAVSSKGTGKAGNLGVRAPFVFLDNQGKLSATSESGKGGGNVTLQDLNLLLLNDNSEISTIAAGTGNGGNITIDTDLLVGLENSDITANANEGRGGFIDITAPGIFGLEVRDPINAISDLRKNNTSDISASSLEDPSLNGVVEINTPDVDPDKEVVNLPEEVVDVGGLVAQGCSAGGGAIARRSSQFVVTGRGGLPPTPDEALKSDTVLVDLGTPVVDSQELPPTSGKLAPVTAEVTPEKLLHQAADRTVNHSSPASKNLAHAASGPIVEAQGWMTGPNGEVVLTTQAAAATPHSSGLTSAACHGS